ncbi:MAG: GAF domain-containing protein, partial [Actinobacteria bacterium]|nr:GAF domain-containing protein [Actinomycetota bacterium]
MDAESKAVLFNAVPLLLVAALYLLAAAGLLPAFRREPTRLRDPRLAAALIYPAVGIAAAILGLRLLVDRSALAGHLWLSLVAILIVAVPAVWLLAGWKERHVLLQGAAGAPKVDEPSHLSRDLVRAVDAESIGSLVADESIDLFAADLAALALVGPDGRTATFVAARERGRDLSWLRGLELDLERESSDVAAVLRDESSFAIFDASASSSVSRRLAERSGAKSCAFVPVFAASRPVGVLVLATRKPRVFDAQELSAMQAFASQAGLALDRAASTAALGAALERERLVARIALEVRTRHELEDVLQVAVEETGGAIGGARCFIRLGKPGAEMPVVAEWDAAGVAPIGDASFLPAVNLAVRDRRTVAIGDVLQAPELRDPGLGDLQGLIEQGVRAVLVTPLVVADEVIGALGLHRSSPCVWSAAELALAEAVAREASNAIEAGRLLRESERRLAEQSALLKAGERQAQSERGFYRIAAMLSEPLSASATLEAVAQAACETLEGDAAAVLRAAGGTLELAASYALPKALASFLAAGGDEALTSCAEAGKVLASRALGTDIRFGGGLAAAAEAAGCRSLLAVPLPQPRTATGGLALVFFRGERTFTDEQLEVAGHVAGAARGALERSELYELERRSRSLAQRLAKASRELASELDPEDVLDQVVQHAVELLGADGA